MLYVFSFIVVAYLKFWLRVMIYFFLPSSSCKNNSCMPIYGLTPTSLPTWRMSNEMHGNPIGPIRSRGTKLSILIGSLAEGPGILLLLLLLLSDSENSLKGR